MAIFGAASNPKSKSKIKLYLFSRCNLWQRQRRQNLFSSSLCGVFFLFFVVT